MNQLTLFNLNSIESVRPAHDPYSVESNGNPLHDPYWDELENWDELKQEQLSIDVLHPISSVPEQSDPVLEQSSFSAPLDKRHLVDGGSPITNKWDNLSHPVPEQSDFVLEQQLRPVPEQNHWIETYCPSNRKEHKYYRYCWKQGGRKINHVHIPGGNTASTTAALRRSLILEAIADGCKPDYIKQLISDWSLERKQSRRMTS